MTEGDVVVVNAQKLHSQGAILPSLIIGIETPELISSAMAPVVQLESVDFLIMEKIGFVAFELLKRDDIISHQLASNLILKSFLPFFKQKISINEHVKKTTPAIVKRAKLFIDDNFDENISIKDVCEALSVSHTYLDQKFRENVGMSPIKYLMSRRIGEAQRLLLEEPDLSITQVSMRVGIYNRNYFQRNFKIFSGISPQQFRILIDKKQFDGRVF